MIKSALLGQKDELSSDNNIDQWMVNLREHKHYKLDHAVTKTQKIILSSFGLDENNISKSADEISKLLVASKSLTSKEEVNDGTEEVNRID